MGKILAIDVSPSCLFMVEGIQKKDEVYVNRTFALDIPAGCIVDGAIADHAMFRSALDSGLKINRIKAKKVMLSINSNATIIRSVEVPSSSERELQTLVEYEMNQYLPTGTAYIIDYVLINEFVNMQGAKMMNIRAAAIPVETSQSYHRIFHESKLKPKAMDIHQNVLSKIFCEGTFINEHDITDKAIVAMDLSSFQTTIYALIDNKVELARTLPVGIGNLERLISDRMQITMIQARSILKEDFNLAFGEEDPAESVRRFLSQYLAEIRKVLQYIKGKNNNKPVDAFFLYGVGASMPGLEKYFLDSLEVPVEIVKSHNRVHLVKNSIGTALAPYLNAAGVLMRL